DSIAWERIKDQDDEVALREFVETYPASRYANASLKRLEDARMAREGNQKQLLQVAEAELRENQERVEGLRKQQDDEQKRWEERRRQVALLQQQEQRLEAQRKVAEVAQLAEERRKAEEGRQLTAEAARLAEERRVAEEQRQRAQHQEALRQQLE